MNQLKVKLLQSDAITPTKAHPTDSGFDLYSNEEVVTFPLQTSVVKTGISFEIPLGYELQVRPRSGVSTKTPIKVILGTVDNSYRGEIGIMCQNISGERFIIPKGYKLAQIVPTKLPDFELVVVDELSNTDRGSNGFGSSGV